MPVIRSFQTLARPFHPIKSPGPVEGRQRDVLSVSAWSSMPSAVFMLRPPVLLQQPNGATSSPVAYQLQSRRLSSCRRHVSFRQRSSLLFLDKSADTALEISTGWWSGRFSGFSGLVWALAAACRSHISLDFTQMSSICSWARWG